MSHSDPELASYERRIAHYLREYDKVKRWRDNRLATLRGQAQRSAATRPTTIHDAESILWAWSNADPKLKEYGAGLEIIERRLTLYGTLAANRRLALQQRRTD